MGCSLFSILRNLHQLAQGGAKFDSKTQRAEPGMFMMHKGCSVQHVLYLAVAFLYFFFLRFFQEK
jgi:hypothetical protein